MNSVRVYGAEVKPTSVIVNTGEDKIALMLGRAQVRAEMLQARVEALEAELAATQAELEAAHAEKPPAKQKPRDKATSKKLAN